jgi:hypothetical protein
MDLKNRVVVTLSVNGMRFIRVKQKNKFFARSRIILKLYISENHKQIKLFPGIEEKCN